MPATDFDADGEQPLLMDPYGRAVDEREGLITSVRVANDFDWGRTAAPGFRGATRSSTRPTSAARPSCTRTFRRTCRGPTPGMAHPAMIEHLISLGVTAVQLLPVHFHVDEPHLQKLGLTNYWGYNTAAFFAPHPGYATEAAQAAGAARGPGRVQGHGQAAACRRPRGHPRRRLQPHRRGRPGRPDPELPRPGRDAVLPQRRPRQVRGHHGLRQQPELRRTPRGPAGAGFPALLGERVPHRRLPLRPRRHAVPQQRQRVRSAAPLPRRRRAPIRSCPASS